ncbi:2-oxoglutarate dehydrogenase complex dihydrolipoyllysine-residue succinyltransferase [Novosphingobium sp. MBES04]|uniref:2-oxoglutarate dehydrogenase complex dihydrolipoyllysine-residue succinyltransferase n=1 Tax=Novosphingobium sp. MBES04 TaxID=1206458 RepID=UPI00057DE1E6|nr:2-oxoglutarate dehydrogenase complex dihydrolipoyllysine-residue succinyltransferase [Novosphingobium sp. MBES04]GAM03131.1 2-oxoglutarate dehydrogenase E2 component [Novosphingobium sp. MBES04]
MSTEIKVPTLGESVTEATIGEWLKQPGEAVAADEPICSLETDKVAIDVMAPHDGVMGEQLAAEGDTVTVDALIATIESGSGGAAAPAAAPKAAAPAPAPAASAPAPAPAASEGSTTDAAVLSPAVRRAVLEYGIDPATIKGTGKDGRITKDDVIAAAKNKPADAPASAGSVAAAPARQEERVKMTRLRQTIAKRLKSAQEDAALLTTFNDVDMSAVMESRNKYKDVFAKKHGIKLGFMSYFAKASVLALKDIPAVNAQIDGNEIVYHDYVDISIAVSAPNGLVVPVVKDCDKLSFAGIEKAIADYGKKAKEGTLTMDDMKGGTFTISNGGVFGGLMSTPIINPPQSAVLGLHRIEDRPVVRNGQIVIRPMMYIALSYDHRIIDGREAVTALKTIKEAIEDPTRLLIDL